jgi:Na+/H+ antiporter NhaA
MSLFIGGLAFAGDESSETAARLGVLAGSLLSLFMAFLAFRLWPDRRG